MIAYSELLGAQTSAAHRIAYGSEALQFGELRLPPGDDRVSTIVFVHGGCWLAEYTLEHARAAADALVREGFAVWLPEYRRLGDEGGGWPGTFDDIAHAVDHVRELAKEYPRIDMERVIVAGHSAGGQLALWAGSRTDPHALRVAGVVSLAGIADMATYGEHSGSCNGSVHRLMGGTPAEQSSRYDDVDPIRRIPITAPIRIVHGAKDDIVPIALSETFAARNRDAGGRSVVDAVADAGHFDLIAPQSTAWPTVVHAIRSLLTQ